MTAVQKEKLEELRKIVLKTGAEEMEWEKLEALLALEKVESKKK